MPKNQLEIPGTERPRVKPIEDAAENYVSVRDKRMKLTEQEIAAKLKLIEVMLRNSDKLSEDGDGNRVYQYDEELVILNEKTNVKVKDVTQPEP